MGFKRWIHDDMELGMDERLRASIGSLELHSNILCFTKEYDRGRSTHIWHCMLILASLNNIFTCGEGL